MPLSIPDPPLPDKDRILIGDLMLRGFLCCLTGPLLRSSKFWKEAEEMVSNKCLDMLISMSLHYSVALVIKPGKGVNVRNNLSLGKSKKKVQTRIKNLKLITETKILRKLKTIDSICKV